MNDSKRGLLAGAMLWDALALGAHWIYDTDEIVKIFGAFDGYTDPTKNPYHKTKKIGDFTHYGDQLTILANSIKKHNVYTPELYKTEWMETMKQYTGYMDHASKITLEKWEGSDSFDASAIGRIAPLLAMDSVQNDEVISDFIGLTHNHKTVKAGAIFITHVIEAIQSGQTPNQALKNTSSDSPEITHFRDAWISTWEEDTIEVIKKFWQSCGIDGVFQGAIHCIIKYENDFKKALLENTKAGGDSAARGMIIGMTLWASIGYEKLPKDWLETMNAKV